MQHEHANMERAWCHGLRIDLTNEGVETSKEDLRLKSKQSQQLVRSAYLSRYEYDPKSVVSRYIPSQEKNSST